MERPDDGGTQQRPDRQFLDNSSSRERGHRFRACIRLTHLQKSRGRTSDRASRLKRSDLRNGTGCAITSALGGSLPPGQASPAAQEGEPARDPEGRTGRVLERKADEAFLALPRDARTASGEPTRTRSSEGDDEAARWGCRRARPGGCRAWWAGAEGVRRRPAGLLFTRGSLERAPARGVRQLVTGPALSRSDSSLRRADAAVRSGHRRRPAHIFQTERLWAGERGAHQRRAAARAAGVAR